MSMGQDLLRFCPYDKRIRILIIYATQYVQYRIRMTLYIMHPIAIRKSRRYSKYGNSCTFRGCFANYAIFAMFLSILFDPYRQLRAIIIAPVLIRALPLTGS